MKKQGVNSYYGEPSFKWKDVGPTNIKKLCAEWNNPTHISGIEKERRYSNRKFFAIVMALLLLVQMQPFSFVFAEDGSDAPKAETSSTEVEKKSVPAPKAEPKPEPKPEPAAEAEVKEEPAAEPETPEAEVKEEPAAEPETPEAEESTSSDESQADEETQDAADTDVAAEEETPTEEEKEEYPAQTLTANADGVKVTLKAPEGSLPEGSKLKAKQVGQKYIDAVESQIGELRDAVAIDVTPVNKDGKEIQPKKTVAVTFSGANLEMESGDEVEVFRVSDDASSVTDMNGSGNANTQSFNTKHFTIYVTGTNPHETHEQNTEAGRYVLEYGESVYLTDDNDSSATNWTASTGASYVELSDRTTTSLTVKNVNSTNNDQVVAIRHGSSTRTYRYFYITAKAKPRTHNVTYDPKGGKIDGSTNPKTITVDDGTTIQLPAAPTDKDNYTFAGWKTGSQIYDAGADYTVSADVSFDAQWTADKYSISYSYAGGTAPKTANPTEYTVEDNINISNEPSRTGYTFTGWTSNDMSTPITTPTTPVNWSAGSESGNKTFTANWEIVDYDITYDYDGGTAPSTDNPTKYNVTDSVEISNEPTKEGYTFKGWTSEDMSTPITTPTTPVNWSAGAESGNKTFTANWEAVKYGITYYYDGGTAPQTANPTEYTVEDSVNISNEPTKEDYTFIGWTGSGIDEPRKTISWTAGAEKGPKSYTANWALTEYSITYELDGGDASSAENPEKYTVADDVEISDEPTKEGYTFKGWTSDDMSTPITTPTTPVNWSAGDERGNKTFTANWEAVEYDIAYNYAGGEEPAEPNPIEYTIEDSIEISKEPTKAGYIFAGWTSFDTHPKIDTPTTPVEWSAGAEYGNKTFTANWKKQVTLTYELNSGTQQATLIPDKRTITLGEGDKIDLATATFTGHQFEEWNTKEDGTGSHHAGGSEYTMPDHDVTLWAQWTEHPITVTYNYNYSGATEPWKKVSAPENDPYYQVVNEKPTRDEYLFVGWSTTKGATKTSEIEYFPGSYLPTAQEDIELYAVWVMEEKEAREYTQILKGFGREVYYTGEEQKIVPKEITAYMGGTAYIGVSSVDNPKSESAGNPDYKYAGYVRVGKKTDGDPAWHNVYAFVEVDPSTEIKGTDAGVYNGPMAAPLYAHEEGTEMDGFDQLTTTDSAGNEDYEYIEITNNQLIIKPVPIVITTNSEKKAHDGKALTAGGKAVIGASDDPAGQTTADLVPGTNPVTLRNGEKVVITIDGSQTDLGSSKNNATVHWNQTSGGAKQQNYTVTKNLGTLTVYDFTAEFYKNTEDDVHGMPSDWEGDIQPPGSRVYTLPTNKPTRAHSKFEGWTINAAGTGTVYQPGGSYTYPDDETDVKFYAKWSEEVDIVTYDPNGGVFDGKTRPTEIPCTYDESHTIREAATRNYYDFVEWNTKKDGSGDKYSPSATYTIKGDVTFYAQWTPKTYTIKYNYDGGVKPAEDNPSTYTVEQGVSITKKPTRKGYTFTGWTGSGITEPQESISWNAGEENGNKEYTANWKADEYTISYSYAGGDAPAKDNPTKYTVNDKVSISNEPTRKGYTFTGWTGSGIDNPQKKISWNAGDETGNKSYTANWSLDQYSISYDYAGGVSPSTPNPTEYTVEDETVSIINKPTRKGYTFTGWTGSGITEPQETISWNAGDETGDKAYTANWTLDQYSISYDYAGGEAPTTDNPVSYTVNDKVNIYHEPTKEGHTFTGWTGSGIDNPQKKISWNAGEETGNKAYTANWSINQYEVTYDPNGGKYDGKTTPTTYEYNYNTEIEIAEEATREHYTFKGWEDTETGSVYNEGDDFTVKKNVSFKAQWEINKYTFEFDPNGGTYEGSTEPFDITEEYSSVINLPGKATRPNYNFLGWEDEDGEVYEPEEEVTVTGDKKFKAKWDPVKLNITYDPNGGVFRGSTDPTDIEYRYKDVIKIAEAPKRDGYTFLYWKGSEYQPGDPYTVWENHTFVAQWDKEETPIAPEEDSDTPSKSGGIGTGDPSHLNNYLVMLLSMIILAALAFKREKEAQAVANAGFSDASNAPKREVKVIRISETCNFRWSK